MERATPLRPTDQRAPELSGGVLELQQHLDESERTFQGAMDSINSLNTQPDPSTELDEVRCSETLRELLALKVKVQKLAATAREGRSATAPTVLTTMPDGQVPPGVGGEQKTEAQQQIESAIGENSKRMLIMAQIMCDKDGYFGSLHKQVIVQASELPVSTAEDRIEDPMERTEAIAKALVEAGEDANKNEQVRVVYRLSAETLKLIIDNIALFNDAATARAIEAKALLDAQRERELAEAEAAAAQQTDGPEVVSLDLETIQEVTDVIEGRIQSYRDQAIEVLGRKRAGVVEALNATLGMQSVVNELKVKGMKHGVSPDLISIPLATLTSGEINENILLQMQERMRSVATEIAQLEKEIALSNPSKWEHSIHKYNTAESWKARFGSARPIEAAAQATGLHDHAERRSREAREEIRLALSAVAEFGGGPEQIDAEDAMEQLQNSPVLMARIRKIHEDAQESKRGLEGQKKELEVMLVYVEECVERAKELKRALDGYDSRLDALTNENSPTGPLLLRLQELESVSSESWDLDAMIEVCAQLRDMYHDAGASDDEDLMAKRIQIIEGLRVERSRAQSAAPPNPPNDAPVAAAGAPGQPPGGGDHPPASEVAPRVERATRTHEHTMTITLPVTDAIEEVFTGLVVDGKQAVIRVELIPNGTERVWREDESKEGGGELVEESRFTPAISVTFDKGDERQKLLLDGFIARGTQTSANVMTVYPGSQDTYRWGIRKPKSTEIPQQTNSVQLEVWCDVDTVRQENVVRIGDGIAQKDDAEAVAVAVNALDDAIQASRDSLSTIAAMGSEPTGEELGALIDQMTALWAQSHKENDMSKKLKCYQDALEIANRINDAEAIKPSQDGILYVESLILGDKISTKVADIVAEYTENADLAAFLTRAKELTAEISRLYAMEVQNSHENPQWIVSNAVDELKKLYETRVMSRCYKEQKYADVIAVAQAVQEILNDLEVSKHTERFQASILGYLAASYEGAKQYSLAISTLRKFIDAAKRVYGGENYNPRSDEERLSQLKALQAEQEARRGTADLPQRIVDELDTAPWIPDKLRKPMRDLYELSWAATQTELVLVAKAEEWAKAAKIPVMSHAVSGFAEFIQGAFSVREGQTGEITDESIQKAKTHFSQWLTNGLKGTAELGELFVGGEAGVLKGILTAEGAELADSSIKRMISGYVMKHVASKLGAVSDSVSTEGSGLKTMGNILAELLQNDSKLTQMAEALEGADGFDAFLARLKEYFSGSKPTA